MKKGILLIILAISTTIGFAQNQKIGHINTQEVLRSMYIKDSIQFKLQAFQTMLEAETRRIQSGLYAEQMELERLKDSLPEEIFNQRYQRLLRESEIFQKETVPQMENSLRKKEASLLQPIEAKITTAIEKVAKANKFTYIVSLEATLYAGGEDITKLVRVELGLPEEAEPLPQAGLPIQR